MVLLLKSNIKHIRIHKKIATSETIDISIIFRTWFGYLEWLARFYIGKKAMIFKMNWNLSRKIICHCLFKHDAYTVPFLKFTQEIKKSGHLGYSKASNVLKSFRFPDVLEESIGIFYIFVLLKKNFVYWNILHVLKKSQVLSKSNNTFFFFFFFFFLFLSGFTFTSIYKSQYFRGRGRVFI